MTRDAHSTTSKDGRLEPLYDVDVPTPTHAERARTLVAQGRTATLCTIGQDPAGYPYGSFVMFALDDASPVVLISDLAEHTKNLRRDPKSSLLVAEGGHVDPLANGRVTLLGQWEELEDGASDARAAYLATHPGAAYYADFEDFHVWRMRVEAIRYIGGYGRMSWVEPGAWLAATHDPIAESAAGIMAHMNDDHGDALDLYCRVFSKAAEFSAVTMTGIDRYGFEMSLATPDGQRPVRLAFPRPICDATEARAALVAMVRAARTEVGRRRDEV